MQDLIACPLCGGIKIRIALGKLKHIIIDDREPIGHRSGIVFAAAKAEHTVDVRKGWNGDKARLHGIHKSGGSEHGKMRPTPPAAQTIARGRRTARLVQKRGEAKKPVLPEMLQLVSHGVEVNTPQTLCEGKLDFGFPAACLCWCPNALPKALSVLGWRRDSRGRTPVVRCVA